MFTVDYYETENGRKPVEEFLEGLPNKMKSKAFYSIALLEEYGDTLRLPYSKSVGNGLFELRIQFSNDICRIFYFFVVGDRIILTNGFIKKSVKAPKGQLKLAKKYKADYERRHKNYE